MMVGLIGKILLLSLIPAGIVSLFLLHRKEERGIKGGFYLRLSLAGAVIVLPTAAVVYVISPFLGNGTAETLIVALIEESAKYILFLLLVFRHRDFHDSTTGALYGAAIAIGFSAAENILYLAGSDSLVPLIFLRAFTALPLHALCGGFMGYYAGINKERERGAGFSALFIPLILHVSYNLLLETPLPVMTLLLLSAAALALYIISRRTPFAK